MNKLILVALLAGGGYAGYRAFHKSDAVLAYAKVLAKIDDATEVFFNDFIV